MFSRNNAPLAMKTIPTKRSKISKKFRNNAVLPIAKKNSCTGSSTVKSEIKMNSYENKSVSHEIFSDSDLIDSINMLYKSDYEELEPVLQHCSECSKESNSFFTAITMHEICSAYKISKIKDLSSHQTDQNSIDLRKNISSSTPSHRNKSPLTNFKIKSASNFNDKNLNSLSFIESIEASCSPQIQETQKNGTASYMTHHFTFTDEDEALDYEFQYDSLETEKCMNKKSSIFKVANPLSFKDFKITINSCDSSVPNKRKSFNNYNVVLPSDDILTSKDSQFDFDSIPLKKKQKIVKKTKKLSSVTKESKISYIAEIKNSANVLNSSFSVAKKRISKCQKISQASTNSDDDLLNERVRTPKDFLELAKSMKITVQDSRRILDAASIDNVNNKNFTLKPESLGKHDLMKSKETDELGEINNNFNCNNQVNLKKVKKRKRKPCPNANSHGINLKKIIEKPDVTVNQAEEDEDVLSHILKEPVEIDLDTEISSPDASRLSPPENFNEMYIDSANMLDLSNQIKSSQPEAHFTSNHATNYYSDDESSGDTDLSFKRMRREHSLVQEKDSSCNISYNLPNSIESREICSSNSSAAQACCSSNASISSLSSASAITSLETLTLTPEQNSFRHEEVLQRGTVQEVIETITSLCSDNEVQTAIALSTQYMSISSLEAQTKIFETLFTNIVKHFRDSNLDLKNEYCQATFNNIKKLINDHKLFDSNIYSTIIYECLFFNFNIPFAFEIFEKCVEFQIPLSEQTLYAYAIFLQVSKNVSNIITFLEYLKVTFYELYLQNLQCDLLAMCIFNENMSLHEFKKLCNFFCNINISGGECSYFQDFFRNCIENGQWTQIHEIFCAQAEKGYFTMIHQLHQILADPLKEAGNNFEKFAGSVFSSSNDLSSNVITLFGQLGTALMLETYAQKELKSTFIIILNLHKYNINYIELQDSDKLIDNYPSLMDFDQTIMFKDSIISIAIKTLLHFERPKDAFDVYQEYPGINVSSTNNSMIDFQIMKLRERYLLLLKIAEHLCSADPFEKGLAALNLLLSAEETGVEFEKDDSFINGLNRIYSNYLAKLMDAEKYDAAIDLYEKEYGPCKGKLKIFPYVRRCLLLCYIKKGVIDKAKKLFYISYLNNNYPLTECKAWKSPQFLWICSSWSVYEIKFAIEMFFQESRPFFLERSKEVRKYLNCFKIRFRIKENKNPIQDVKFLNEIQRDAKSCLVRLKEALNMIDSSLEYVDVDPKVPGSVEKALDISPECFFQYWKNKFCKPGTKVGNNSFVIQSKERISFGEAVVEKYERSAEDFGKIETFLMAKIHHKDKDMSSENQQKKANNLAISFIKEHNINKLEKKSMKLLHEFAEKHV